jgi:mono/diheme cytochrome c family protein
MKNVRKISSTRAFAGVAIAGIAVAGVAMLGATTTEVAPPTEGPQTSVATTSAGMQTPQPDGKAIYEASCASCHGKQGRGNGRAGRVLDPRPTDISDPDFLDSNADEELIQVLLEGKGSMAPYADVLSREELEAVMGYVRELGEKRRE